MTVVRCKKVNRTTDVDEDCDYIEQFHFQGKRMYFTRRNEGNNFVCTYSY